MFNEAANVTRWRLDFDTGVTIGDEVSAHPSQVGILSPLPRNESFINDSVFSLDQSFRLYMEYQASEWLLYTYRPLCATFGMAGNLLSIVVVMTTPQLRQSSTSVFMVALSLLDWLISMYAALTLLPKESFIGEQMFFTSTLQCRLHYFAILFVIHFDTLTMVAMTVQRFIAVRHPLQAAVWNTRGGAGLSLLLAAAVAFLANVVHLWTFNLQPFDGRYRGRCSPGEGLGQFIQMRVYPWLDSAIYFFIPSISISFFNVFIYRALREATQFKQTAANGRTGLRRHGGVGGGPFSITKSTIPSSPSSDSGLDLSFSADMDTVGTPSGEKPSREISPGVAPRATSAAPTDARKSSTQLSKMLLCVSIAFLVLTSPLGVFIVVFRYWNPPSGHEKAIFTLIYDVTECLMFTNHSINFLLYCVSGTRFREKAVSILLCAFRKTK